MTAPALQNATGRNARVLDRSASACGRVTYQLEAFEAPDPADPTRWADHLCLVAWHDGERYARTIRGDSPAHRLLAASFRDQFEDRMFGPDATTEHRP